MSFVLRHGEAFVFLYVFADQIGIPVPAVHATGIALSAPDWAREEQLAAADLLEVRLSWRALLSGHIAPGALRIAGQQEPRFALRAGARIGVGARPRVLLTALLISQSAFCWIRGLYFSLRVSRKTRFCRATT